MAPVGLSSRCTPEQLSSPASGTDGPRRHVLPLDEGGTVFGRPRGSAPGAVESGRKGGLVAPLIAMVDRIGRWSAVGSADRGPTSTVTRSESP